MQQLPDPDKPEFETSCTNNYTQYRTPEWRVILLSLLVLFVGFISCSPSADDSVQIHFPGEQWEWFENAEAGGWSQAGLDAVEQAIDSLDTDALMIVHRGRVVRAWGDLEYKHRCHSIRKSLLSALYGIQVAERRIDPDATMEDFEIDDNEALTDTEKQATVRMLLKARSGVYHPALFETAAMAERRPERYSHLPDTHWYYNNWDFNALGTIYERETGENIHESFYHRIAGPVGMQDYQSEDGRYVTGEASRHAAYPFVMSTRDLARFGLLYLNNGQWNGRQIIPESWVEESTTSWSDAGNSGGYGYLWWVSVDGRHFSGVENVPDGTYTARGYRGHVVAVVPQYDLVVVHRVNTFEPELRVSYGDFGKILTMILDAYDKS